MSVTDEQHKALSTLYVRFCQKKKNYLSLIVDISGQWAKKEPEKKQESARQE